MPPDDPGEDVLREDRVPLVRLRRILPAGLVDAACSSLATFLIGIYATRYFEPAELGAYALFFSAFVLAAVVPTQLLFTPAEIQALAGRGRQRLRLLDQSIRFGLLPALVPAVLAAVAALAGTSNLPIRGLLPLAVTAMLASFVSPIQDHVRRTLHLAGVSWHAAVVSSVHLVCTAASLAVFAAMGTPLGWVPFGALSIANVVSLSAGLWFASRGRRFPQLPPLAIRDLVRTGRWLLIGGITPQGSVFVSALMVTHLASAAALGYVEAARLVSQPLIVLATGLSAVTGPRLMEAGRRRHERAGLRVARIFEAIMLLCGFAYLGVVGSAWSLNPMRVLIPKAYEIRGLASLTVFAVILLSAASSYRYELLGGRRERVLIGLEGSAAALQCGVVSTAGIIGSYAVPLGMFAQAVARWILFHLARIQLYATPAPVEPKAEGG